MKREAKITAQLHDREMTLIEIVVELVEWLVTIDFRWSSFPANPFKIEMPLGQFVALLDWLRNEAQATGQSRSVGMAGGRPVFWSYITPSQANKERVPDSVGVQFTASISGLPKGYQFKFPYQLFWEEIAEPVIKFRNSLREKMAVAQGGEPNSVE